MMAAPIIPTGLSRRRFLIAGAVAGLSGLAACSRTPVWGATFYQPWRDDAQAAPSTWRSRLQGMRELGFNRVILQWIGRKNGDEDWLISDRALEALLDQAHDLGLRVTVGLPYDERWDAVVASNDLSLMSAFFNGTLIDCNHVVGNAPWRRHKALAGWYIPYEIDQHSWALPERSLLLAHWLKRLNRCMQKHSEQIPRISTYVSQLPSDQTLEGLWAELLDANITLRPMLQDGVGVGGFEHYQRLRPLQDLLISARIDYDLILELFVEKNGVGARKAQFDAKTASYERIEQQLRAYQESGAKGLVAFAADPWITTDTPEAQALRKRWLARPPRASRRPYQ